MSVPPRSQQHGQRVVDIALEGLQQLGAKRTVDRAMVDRQRAGRDRGRHDLTLAHDGPLLAHADSEDAALRRIDPRLELLDAEHAEIRDREGDRKSVVEGKSVSGRVGIGGSRNTKKKKKKN